MKSSLKVEHNHAIPFESDAIMQAAWPWLLVNLKAGTLRTEDNRLKLKKARSRDLVELLWMMLIIGIQTHLRGYGAFCN